ncbi:DUF1853 family protein [Veronia nyctiphanis]|uniref:DUF1853 family protein n=1 Tax=Veronia nyctiphanis TaxID=1278244 RepID=UPI001F452DBB|nr:DUF1853 family protein [Veronia nyctiphanis]
MNELESLNKECSLFSSLTQIAKDSDWLIHAPQLTHLPQQLMVPSNFWSSINTLKKIPLTRYEGGHRIGFYYQWLVQQLLTEHPTYKLLAEEVQVNDNGRTLGSVDFLVEAPGEEIEHWEVAVKFYLAYENQWYGPNAKDTLAKKQQKMLDHQLLITDTKAYQDQFPEMKPAHRRLLMQGRLYVTHG